MIHPDQDFARFLSEGRFMLQRDRASGDYIFYPRVAMPGSGSLELEWVEACGRGTVYSIVVIHQTSPKVSYNVALINLAEGPRMMSRVVGMDSADVKIGMPVTAEIIREGDTPLVVFRASGVTS